MDFSSQRYCKTVPSQTGRGDTEGLPDEGVSRLTVVIKEKSKLKVILGAVHLKVEWSSIGIHKIQG